MKFTYEHEADDRDCVAYIDGDGDLVMRGGYIVKAGWIENAEHYFNPSEATHKFYPGDKLTIEF